MAEHWNGDVAWVTPTDLGRLTGHYITTSERRITTAGYESCGTDMVPPGSIILSSRAPIGYLAIATVPLCTNQGCKSLVPGPDVDSLFLYYSLLQAVQVLRELGSGATFSEVSKSQVEEFRVALPPLAEQKRIAAALAEQMAAVERARIAAEAQREAAKVFRRACFRAAFESDVTQDWDRVRLGDLALSIQNGIFKAAPYYGHGKPLLRMYNLQKDSWLLDLDRLALAELSAAEAATFQVMPGDLLISRVNSFELVGKCSVVDQLSAGFAFENMLIRVRLHERAEPLFIVQQMSTDHIRRQIERVAKRAIGQASINSDDIRQLQLMIPPLSAQRQIASDLALRSSAADGLKERLEMECEVIAKLPAALLRRAFSGEL